MNPLPALLRWAMRPDADPAVLLELLEDRAPLSLWPGCPPEWCDVVMLLGWQVSVARAVVQGDGWPLLRLASPELAARVRDLAPE